MPATVLTLNYRTGHPFMRKCLFIVLLILLSGCSAQWKSLFKFDATSIYMPGTKEKIPIIEWKNVPLKEYSIATPLKPEDPATNPIALKDIAYKPKPALLQAGDVIEVTVFDAGEDGLFSSANSKELKLGRATIDRNGTVTLPFLNTIPVRNLTAEALKEKIAQGLKGFTINPQVVLSVISRASNDVMVNGAVKNPGRYPLEAGRDKILDILTLAGGATVQNGQVTLIRNKTEASSPMNTLPDDNSQNIALLSGDQITINSDETGKFTAVGAFKTPGDNISFEPGKLSLTQAIARAGGTISGKTPVNNIYILRKPSSLPPADQSPEKPAKSTSMPPKMVAYHLKISDVSSFLSMQNFYVRDGDTLFASEDPISKW